MFCFDFCFVLFFFLSVFLFAWLFNLFLLQARLWTIKYNTRIVNTVISLFGRQVGTFSKAFKAISRSGKGKTSGVTSIVFPFNMSIISLKKNTLLSLHRLLIYAVFLDYFRESISHFVVLGGYCYLDLSMTFGKLSSNLNEMISKILRDLLQFFHSTFTFPTRQ